MNPRPKQERIPFNDSIILVAVGAALLLALVACNKDDAGTNPIKPKPTYSERWYFLWEGYARVCLVYLPKDRASQAGLPVVFSLHSYDETYEELQDYLQTHLLGDSVGFITVYPNAIEKHWNSGISDNPNYPTPNVNDVGFISLIIDSLIKRYQIDTTRVYSCGGSNGGFMSLKLAAQLGSRITAVASVSGVISRGTGSSYSTTRAVPTLLMHGTSDGQVPYNGDVTGWYSVDETIQFFRNRNSCLLPAETLFVANINTSDLSTVEKYTYRSSTNGSQVVLFKVINGIHSWPRWGPDPYGIRINRDIDATREIWNFFKQFSLAP
jgi:polyhydroxybutyrate depolymerase